MRPQLATTTAVTQPAPRTVLDQVKAFHYVTSSLAPTYRAIVEAFFEAKQCYVIELRPADVLHHIAAAGFVAEVVTADDLAPRLEQLIEWGILGSTHDTAAVARIEDFYRKRSVYHLTPVGETAHRAVREVEATIGRSGSLQATMLLKIRDSLRDLGAAARSEAPVAEVLAGWFHDLFAAFDSLTAEASRFLGDLHRYLDGERTDEERFVAQKQAVLAYIGRFLDQLHRLAEEIEGHLTALGEPAIVALVTAAAQSADLPPALDGDDPAAAWRARQLERWQGLRAWFVPGQHGEAPRVAHLTAVAVEAVVGLARALARLNDRRTRPVDRAADFRTLARWFAACETDAQAHAIWAAAFGLYSSRHVQIAEEDAELTAATTSWWEAAPVAVPVRLRTHGRVSRAGRAAAAPDHTSTRVWIAQVQRRERDQVETAMRRFRNVGPLWLREVATLDETEFDLLLGLLDDALSAPPGPDDVRTTSTADGGVIVTLEPPGLDEECEVTLRTPRGLLHCRNYRIDVADAAPGRAIAGGRSQQRVGT